jgi:threonine aldolase
MPHQVKVHGASMFMNWTNAAMALHRLEGFESRIQLAIKNWKTIMAGLNKIPGIRVNAIEGGTNIYLMELDKAINPQKLQENLRNKHNIRIGPRSAQIPLSVNETLLHQSPESIVEAFSGSV